MEEAARDSMGIRASFEARRVCLLRRAVFVEAAVAPRLSGATRGAQSSSRGVGFKKAGWLGEVHVKLSA